MRASRSPRWRRPRRWPTSDTSLLKKGWPKSFPIVQVPNAPLAIALVGSLVGWLTHGSVHAYARAVFFAAFAAWAWLELSDGVNWARRVIGAVLLVSVVFRIANALGA